ncbi:MULTISPECIES: hypothetical protein [unclassified Ornithinimicrobium]|uniref:hypothetical protein n=1 Tax=unclassified Ornithinimicrobium TaxID=2615080 RepID=UPI0038541F06
MNTLVIESDEEKDMSRSSDRSQDPSPFAWIFGAALSFVALGAATRAVLDRRDRAGTPAARPVPTRDSDDETLAGHPS